MTLSYVTVDTPVTQTVNQYSTALIATLNGSQVFSQAFATPFSDPTVQAAVLLADAFLAGGGGNFGAPFLASGSTSLLGSQVSYVQTGEQATGDGSFLTSDTFGPAVVSGCPTSSTICLEEGEIILLPSGQL